MRGCLVSFGLCCFSTFSFCCCGVKHFMWNRIVPKLDLLLWFRWDVHVLLRPLADLRVRDPALWPVSHTFSPFFIMIITQPLFCSYMNPELTTSSQGWRDGGADRHHHHVSDDGFRRSEPLAEHGNRTRRFVQSHLSTITVHAEEHFHSPWLYGPLVLTLNILPHQFLAFSCSSSL